METKRTKKLASKEYFSLSLGGREIAAYERANGDIAVRLYLGAGEMLPNEALYAYQGPSREAARDAWRATVAQWDALYAEGGAL